MYANKIIPLKNLPIKLVAFGHSFRTEIGGRGLATKGLYRVVNISSFFFVNFDLK
jgi:seryl-tRNA synthetase